ncbi:ABC transporter substrate-binding protein [Nonomuraea sp. NPDC050663]|uniref:ABC transporter substrate-binding protein n=1 Tax=Nonomuraea sp. NPDC050663 TaxID=3364370 RepID=UPI003792BB20
MRRIAVAVLALALVGCGADAGDPQPAASGSASGSAAPRTLTLWHYESADGAMGKAWAEAVKKFEATHPGVTVKFEQQSFEQLQKTASLALNSDSAPDVMEFNKGNATTGLLSKQGLLTDMSAEVTKRGWDKKLPGGLQTTSMYDERGVMGSGKWYGVTNYGEFVMAYYNKALFDKHGVQVPTTYDELVKALDAFVAKGVTPIANSGQEYPAQQIFYSLALSKADKAWVDAYQSYKGTVDFHGPQFTHAATTYADWVKKGYVAKNSAGLVAEDMGVAFMGGKFPIMISGSWWYGRVQSTVKDFEWGIFPFPGNTLHPGSGGNLWVVPEKARNKDLAYDFIDITMSPEIQNIMGNSGGLPVAADATAITDAKSKELIETFGKVSSGLAFYPDWPAPGYYDVLVGGVQKLINGKAEPAAVLDELAKPYQENLESLGN